MLDQLIILVAKKGKIERFALLTYVNITASELAEETRIKFLTFSSFSFFPSSSLHISILL